MNFYCDICFKSFTTIQAFKSHERSNKHLLKILQKESKNLQQNEKTVNKEVIDENLVENDSDVEENKESLYLSEDNNNSSLDDLMEIENKDSFQEVRKFFFLKKN